MFISKKEASRITGLNSEELATVSLEKGITRWTEKKALEVKQALEVYQPQLNQSTPEPTPSPQPEIPHEEPQEETQEPQQQKQPENTAITESQQSNLTELQQHQRETKEALEVVNQGLTEQFAQDAIALGQMDAVQKVALRVQSSRKTELHLLSQLAQSSQQTTQQQLQASQSAFEGKMLELNGTAETLGKAQLNSHSHQKKLAQTQTNLEETIIF